MQQSINFSEVTDYSLDLKASGLVLKIKQGDKITDILVSETPKGTQPRVEAIVKAATFGKKHKKRPKNSGWRPGLTKLDEQKVTEIRQLWPDAMKEHHTAYAASRAMARMYGCSAPNIMLIVKRKSWAHV